METRGIAGLVLFEAQLSTLRAGTKVTQSPLRVPLRHCVFVSSRLCALTNKKPRAACARGSWRSRGIALSGERQAQAYIAEDNFRLGCHAAPPFRQNTD